MAWYRMLILLIPWGYFLVMLHLRSLSSVFYPLTQSINVVDILNKHDKHDSTSLPESIRSLLPNITDFPAQKWAFGIPKEYNLPSLHPAMSQAWSTAISLLQSSGHTITKASLPRTKEALSAYYVLATAEAASNLARYDGVRYGHSSESDGYREGVLTSRVQGLGDEVRRRLLLGNYTLSARYSRLVLG